MKKAIRIILGIIWLLLTIFLLAGLIFPQVKYEVQTTIDMPIDQTFTLFNDISQIPKWMPEIKKITPIEETPNQIGSSYKIIMDNRGTEMEIEDKVLDYKENEAVELEFDVGGMLKKNRFTFAEQDGKTLIRHQATARGQSYMNRCFFAFLKGQFKKIDQQALDNFKQFAES